MGLMDFLPHITALATGGVSWVGSYLMSKKKYRQELKSLEESNKHEIEKLMKQHEIDINSLKEKHAMEMEKLNVEHKHKLEIMDRDSENALIRQKQEQQASQQSALLQSMSGGLAPFMEGLLNNPNIKARIDQGIAKSFNDDIKK
ncbi:MAG: hypothetical protein FWB98_08290 [Defluviitaleaceae bacterium]|nr:hypothetical protein [Defluviitaleaceae bacterium]